MHVIRKAAQSNTRAIHSTSASYVSNIVHLRDHVLYKFDTPSNTKEILRGSSYLGDKPFGSLPDSLEANLHSLQGKDFRCSKKSSFSTASFSSTKRPFPSQGALPVKWVKRPQSFLKPAATTYPYSFPYSIFLLPTGFLQPSWGNKGRNLASLNWQEQKRLGHPWQSSRNRHYDKWPSP